MNALIAPLHDAATAVCVAAERAMNHRLMGGCQVPVAGYAVLERDRIRMRGLVGEPDGSQILSASAEGSVVEPEALGIALAEELLARGAERILRRLLEA